jgi:cell division protein FtsA
VAQHAFGMPVRVGIPGDGLTGLADSVRRPQFAAATGLALIGAEILVDAGFTGGFGDGFVGKVRAWIREFF